MTIFFSFFSLSEILILVKVFLLFLCSEITVFRLIFSHSEIRTVFNIFVLRNRSFNLYFCAGFKVFLYFNFCLSCSTICSIEYATYYFCSTSIFHFFYVIIFKYNFVYKFYIELYLVPNYYQYQEILFICLSIFTLIIMAK